MAHSWRKRFLNRPLVHESPRFNFTAVQILDFTGEGSAVETKRVHVEETARSQLPELSEGTAVRWIHMKTLDMDYDLLMNFALTHQEFTKEERVSVYRLLKQFRGDQQRSSNHGKYFEPACLQQTQLSKGVESEHQPQFISLPYISLGQASSLVNSLLPLRRSIHPIFSLLQHHHRRESAASTASRDSEQTCTKLLGSGPNPIVLVNNLWILILNRSTIITVAPTDGDQLWSHLKLINSCDVKAPETGKVNLWEALDEFASQLQQKLELAIADLEDTLRYQRRIKSSLPASLIEMVEKRFSKSEEPLNGFLGFLYLLINTEWTIKLQYRFSTLDSFLSGNRARFEGRKNAEKCEISEEVELQSESLCLFFYENVETYIKKFTKLRGRAAILLLFPSNKATLDTLWLDVKHQSQLFLWKLSAMDLNTEVMAATGLSEFAQMRDIPTGIEQLVALAVGSLVPENSTETTSPTIGDIYSQYIAHLQLEAQKFPSKALIRNIYQVTEELEIIAGIVKSQYRVVAQMVQVFQAWNQNTNTSDHKGNPPYLETLNKTLQKLQFSQADLEEYQNSCSRLANLAAQRLVDSRLEHIGKTVLTLTTVTMIFLPLLFISNLFGMNFVDIREMEANQWIFWVSALCVTFAVGSIALVMAFFGERLVRKIRRSSEGEENCGRRFTGVKES